MKKLIFSVYEKHQANRLSSIQEEEHTEGEEQGVNICCSSASALCQTGNNDGKSWNSPVVSLVTGLAARKSSRSMSCRPKPELNELLSL